MLGGHDVGEGSRSLALYGRDLGLIFGFARSVRERRSKLRYALQPLSRAEVSLVRGREVWRITGARPLINYSREWEHAPLKLGAFKRMLSLVRRLVHGEAAEGGIFAELCAASEMLMREPLTAEEMQGFERVVVFRLLSRLGYAPHMPALSMAVREPLSRTLLVSLEGERDTLLREINKSLLATQL